MTARKRIRARDRERKAKSSKTVKPQAKKKRGLPPGLKEIGRPRERDRERKKTKAAKARRAKRPLSRAEAREFFGLGRGETKSLAKRAGVSEATIRRWEREGIPERRTKAIRTALDRSKAAKRAVRFRESHRSRRDLVGNLHGRNRADRMLLQSMIESRDARFEEFMKRMRRLGFTTRGARDEWFSPKVL